MERHRIALESRSGIWLMFYETLISYVNVNVDYTQFTYKQQLLRIFKSRNIAEKAAISEGIKRRIRSPILLRDDSKKNEMLRKG